ncbi:hypothetical protein JXA63_04625 [Candidatus Woesebacteria bacterium]|nr:hypothetical protein [Candidatus Woesebacteria bacterium]
MQGNWRQKYLRYKSYLLNTVDRYKERTDIRIYLEILLSLVTISVFSIFALRPTILTIAELIKEIDAKEQLVQKLDDKIETISQAQALYYRERENIGLLKNSIPENPEADTLTYQLEGLVEKNSLIAQSVNIGETKVLGISKNKSKEDNTYISFNISVVGEYGSLYSFIKDLEDLYQPIKIINTSIVSTENKDTGKINLVLTLNAQAPYRSFDQH